MKLAWFLELASVGVLSVLSATLGGCVVESDPPPPPVSTAGGTPVGPGTGNSTGPSKTPMLVDVDPNVTMTATPGDGVGVFNEYVTGGHWHVWWTCDTNKTSQPCNFDVKISAKSGSVSAARSDQFATSDTLNNGAGSLEAVTNTTSNVEGVYFDTPPGDVITLEASIGGVESGQFLFFVQKGEVNGGFTGTLTDPLMLEGASP
jgi:hypothetical protein